MADDPNAQDSTDDADGSINDALGAESQEEMSDVERQMADALAQAQASVQEIAQETGDALGVGRDAPVDVPGIEILSDVNLHVTVELGRTRMLVEDVLKLGEGSVVELDKLAGDPVDIYVNQRLVARGEVLVLNDNFCIRISEIFAAMDEAGVPAQA